MRVLAADDDEALARVLERQLRGWGYDTTLALSGIEAWRTLKRADAPKVAILDWDMPGLSGLEVCRLFRSTPHGADAYILLLTGRAAKEDLVQALESGADDFLSKPYHSRELQLRLAKGIRDAARGRETPAMSFATVPPPSGSTLGGKYRLERKIGEGGMGSVWLGVHLSLGINVAIKFMAKSLSESPDYVSFEREARAAARLRNEHIVRVYDHGIAEDGAPYLVMEYLAGDSLAHRVDSQGPLSPSALVSLVDQVASALMEAHEQGVVHGDVKPENILRVEELDHAQGSLIKLIDFGLAKAVLPRAPSERRDLVRSPMSTTRKPQSLVAGTPLFMSPEALTSSAPPSPRFDLWGLAVTAYFAATGVPPFEAESLVELSRRICDDPLPKASLARPGLPPAFDAWFERACARDPEARYRDASELAAALAAACLGSTTPESSPGERAAKSLRSLAPTEPETELPDANRAPPNSEKPVALETRRR